MKIVPLLSILSTEFDLYMEQRLIFVVVYGVSFKCIANLFGEKSIHGEGVNITALAKNIHALAKNINDKGINEFIQY